LGINHDSALSVVEPDPKDKGVVGNSIYLAGPGIFPRSSRDYPLAFIEMDPFRDGTRYEFRVREQAAECRSNTGINVCIGGVVLHGRTCWVVAVGGACEVTHVQPLSLGSFINWWFDLLRNP
jgi:hypothetical protein